MAESRSHELLSRDVLRWVHAQGWKKLRGVQEAAIPAVLGDGDVVIAAATAGGKTEAAFLPIMSALGPDDEAGTIGFRALAVSPLKALINDQHRRLQGLGEAAGITVHAWHGDVAQGAKRRALRDPGGLLIITPESLEAMFVLRGTQIAALFGSLRYCVIDELHAFIASERGVQLQSLLHRLEKAIGRSVPRIGLSATLGDLTLAGEALRPGRSDAATIVEVKGEGAELKVGIRGYVAGSDDEGASSAEAGIAEHLFKVLRGDTHLVFCGARGKVETYTDRLTRMSEAARVPCEFVPHHGSLSGAIRLDAEARLRDPSRPATALCTTTLELGIDVGDVRSVAQIGTPTSVAALRQRLGRSGRRPPDPAILRIYTIERKLTSKSALPDRLRLGTALGVAAIELLTEGWCEPPRRRSLHLSTLLHQILSVVRSSGGARADALHDLLCGTGPFVNVDRRTFVALLRRMADPELELIEQTADGTIMLGRRGETLIEHFSFYAVFHSPEEYRVVEGSRTLGTLEVTPTLAPRTTILFAGRRWMVREVRDEEKVVVVVRDASGRPPFNGAGHFVIHDRLVDGVRKVLAESDGRQYPYLEAVAARHLGEGRAAFVIHDLRDRRLLEGSGGTWLLPWVGTVRLRTLCLALRTQGLEVEEEGLLLLAKADVPAVREALRRLANGPPPGAIELARLASGRERNKFDELLGDDLLAEDFAADQIDLTTLHPTVRTLRHE